MARIPLPSVVSGARKAGRALDDVAEAIANPPPDRPLARRAGEAGQRFCDFYGSTPGLFQATVGSVVFPVGKLVCEPYFRDRGYDGPVIEPPYEGGQCPALYRATGALVFSVRLCSTGQVIEDISESAVTEFRLQGPLGGLSIDYDQAGTCGPRRITLRVQTATGPQIITSFTNPGGNAVQDGRFEGGFERQGGLPDDCGNPPAEVRPGANPPPNPGPYPPGEEPGIDPISGQPYYTVPDEPNPPPFGPTPIDDPFPYPDGEDPGGGGGGADVAPTTPGSPGGSSGTGAGGESEGEAGEGEELTGVLVEVLAAPANANTFDNVSEVVYRGVGYVSMGYPGLLGLDTSAAVMPSSQFFHAQQRGLTAWRVRANVGYSLRATPYYRELE